MQHSTDRILTTHAGSLPRPRSLIALHTAKYGGTMAVGDPRRIIAGTDCGFETAAGSKMVIEDVVWAKLRSLSEGAAIAAKRLLG
jgi:methionine synthase II (cobalamin-independent)